MAFRDYLKTLGSDWERQAAQAESFHWTVRPEGEMFEGDIYPDGSAFDGPTVELMRCGWSFVVLC